MNFDLINIIIVLFVLLGGVIGFKTGALKKLISIIGIILVISLSFVLKNHISAIFYEYLPFLKLWGIFRGVAVFNIIFYEMVAFIIVSGILTLIYRLILSITGIVEKILDATVILSIPSKIIGLVLGLLESYFIVYVVLFILTLPLINLKDIYNSKVANYMLTETPILSKYTKNTMELYNNLYDIVSTRGEKTEAELNEESMKLMLKYEIITPASAQKLIDKKKVIVNDSSFIESYR